MLILMAVVCGFILDCFLGDPSWMPHPVVYMGKAITWAEKRLRAAFPGTPEGEFRAGLCLAAGLPLLTLLLSGGVCLLASRLHPLAGFAVQTLWCWQALAMRGLAAESRNVWRTLQTEDLPAAQKAVGRIVGRDTERLTAEGVIKAAVETVADVENLEETLKKLTEERA